MNSERASQSSTARQPEGHAVKRLLTEKFCFSLRSPVERSKSEANHTVSAKVPAGTWIERYVQNLRTISCTRKLHDHPACSYQAGVPSRNSSPLSPHRDGRCRKNSASFVTPRAVTAGCPEEMAAASTLKCRLTGLHNLAISAASGYARFHLTFECGVAKPIGQADIVRMAYLSQLSHTNNGSPSR